MSGSKNLKKRPLSDEIKEFEKETKRLQEIEHGGDYVTIKRMSSITGLTVQAIQNWCHRGTLEYVNVRPMAKKGRFFIPVSEVERIIKKLKREREKGSGKSKK